MIDFVKIRIKDLRLRETLLNKKELTFSRERGKLVSNEYKNLVFNICDSGGIEFKGSLHKFFNDGEHNWNDFNRVDVWDTIVSLCDWLQIEPKETQLHNLEFGVNVLVPFLPDKIVSDLIAYKGNSFGWGSVKKGTIQQAVTSDYLIKCYNKSKQFNRKDYILRFEVKVIRMRYLSEVGIKTLQDLQDIKIFNILGEYLLEAWNNILIREHFPKGTLIAKEIKVWNDATNAYQVENLNRKKRHQLRQDYEALIAKYSQGSPYIVNRKKVVGEILANKWDELKRWNVCTDLQPCNDISEKEHLHHSSIVYNRSKNKVCKVTNINIEGQRSSSVFISENAVKKNSDKIKKMLKVHRQNRRKHDLPEEYYLAHNVRNLDSNGRNNLRRRIEKILNEPSLFNATEFLSLTVEQKEQLKYWKNTKWGTSLSNFSKFLGSV